MLTSNTKFSYAFLIILVLSFFAFPYIQKSKAQFGNPWWVEYKDISGTHQIGGPFVDDSTKIPLVNGQDVCKTWESKNLLYTDTIIKDCFQSPTKPTITPEACPSPRITNPITGICECPSPKVFDSKTNTCICAKPQVLDPKTNTCVASASTDTTYTPLAPLPGLGTPGCVGTGGNPCIDTQYNKDTNPCPFGDYLNIIIKIFLGICAVLAVIMIVWGGIQYMTSELISAKEAGKESILHAIFGLLLGLGAFVILNTINPNLLNACLNNLPQATITLGEESSVNPNPISNATLQSKGITCPGSGGATQLSTISQSFSGHVTYDQSKRHTLDTSTIYLDCSSYISQLYSCAGLTSPGNTSTDMFNANNATTDLTGVAMGDILGWKAGESTKYKSGHVFMSLGGDVITEVSNPPGGVNANAHTSSLNHYKSEIKHLKKVGATNIPETFSAVTFVPSNKSIVLTINNFVPSKSHKVNIYYPGLTTLFKSVADAKCPTIPIPQNAQVFVTLTDTEYNILKGQTVNVSAWSAGAGLDTKSLTIP